MGRQEHFGCMRTSLELRTHAAGGENPQTCSDHAEAYLSTGAVDVGRILDLADIGAIVGELDLLNDDGGIAAHDVPGPDHSLPENAIRRRIWPLLVVEDLRKQMGWVDRVQGSFPEQVAPQIAGGVQD